MAAAPIPKPATPSGQGGLFGQGAMKPPPVPATGTVTLPIFSPAKQEATVPKMEPPKIEVKKVRGGAWIL